MNLLQEAATTGDCAKWYAKGRRKAKSFVTKDKKSDFLVTTDVVQNIDVTYGAIPLSPEIYICQ